ncbi:MAG: hypothetical protein AAF202_02160, partial [Pseudomonadota bacterium]
MVNRFKSYALAALLLGLSAAERSRATSNPPTCREVSAFRAALNMDEEETPAPKLIANQMSELRLKATLMKMTGRLPLTCESPDSCIPNRFDPENKEQFHGWLSSQVEALGFEMEIETFESRPSTTGSLIFVADMKVLDDLDFGSVSEEKLKDIHDSRLFEGILLTIAMEEKVAFSQASVENYLTIDAMKKLEAKLREIEAASKSDFGIDRLDTKDPKGMFNSETEKFEKDPFVSFNRAYESFEVVLKAMRKAE